MASIVMQQTPFKHLSAFIVIFKIWYTMCQIWAVWCMQVHFCILSKRLKTKCGTFFWQTAIYPTLFNRVCIPNHYVQKVCFRFVVGSILRRLFVEIWWVLEKAVFYCLLLNLNVWNARIKKYLRAFFHEHIGLNIGEHV